MTREDCATADWERIGEDDGDRGRPPEHIERHAEACARHGLEPDRAAWELGYAGGLDDYCSLDGGIAAGRRGDSYNGLCAAGYEDDFLDGHRIGRALGHAERAADDAERRLRQIRFELSRRDLPDELRSRLQLEYFRVERQLASERSRVEQLQRRIESLRNGR